MVALFDLDSLVYDSLYRVASIAQMKEFIEEYGKKGQEMQLSRWHIIGLTK